MKGYQYDEAILRIATHFVDAYFLKAGQDTNHDPALRYELIQQKAHQISKYVINLFDNLEQYSA